MIQKGRTVLDYLKNQRDQYLAIIDKAMPKHKYVVIYGAGLYGKRLCDFLTEQKINVDAFAVSSTKMNKTFYRNIPILPLADIIKFYPQCLFLVGVQHPTNKEIIDTLNKHNCRDYVDSPVFLSSLIDSTFTRPVMEVTTVVGCKINCRYCPQRLFVKQYKKSGSCDKMSMENFKFIIDKLPSNILLDFSGFAEPFLNDAAIEMMEYANERGYDMRLFTTLTNIDNDKLKRIVRLPFKSVVLHLPDRKNYANIKIDDDYLNLIKNVVSQKKHTGEWFVDFCHCQAAPHEKLLPIINGRLNVSWNINDRAGNLSSKDVTGLSQQLSDNDKDIYCSRALNLDHNVLLPNGDVVLCCQDFGITNKLGNLLEMSYPDINKNGNASGGGICRRCSQARTFVNM